MKKSAMALLAGIALLTGSILLVAGQRLNSQEYNQKDLDNLFDKSGKTPIADEVQKFKFQPMPHVKADATGLLRRIDSAALPEDLSTALQPVPNRYVPSYHEGITNFPPFHNVKARTADPLFQRVPAKERDGYIENVKGVENERSTLLQTSSQIDARDGALYQEEQTLLKQAEILENWLKDLNSRIDQFNAICANNPNPPSNCEQWERDLLRESTQFEAEHKKFGDLVATWKRNVESLKSWNVRFEDVLRIWAAAVHGLLQKVDRALDRVRDCEDEQADYEETCSGTLPTCSGLDCIQNGKISRQLGRCESSAESLNQCLGGDNDSQYAAKAREAKKNRDDCIEHIKNVCCQDYDELRGAVTRDCHSGETRSCVDIDSGLPRNEKCSVFRIYKTRNLACYASRVRVMQKCFNGGDDEHQEQAAQELKAVKNCQDRIDGECVGEAVIQLRR